MCEKDGIVHMDRAIHNQYVLFNWGRIFAFPVENTQDEVK
jgi:hypothetical protein